ncbi:microtubule-associated tumor suppressor candidate 2 homolog [Brachionichthys hirsutus]|uniref:microtubule-associated tumor suppressor candidate 2 homolog n=1 Tax=Brachionichthys hirsutus TaxID=412623 RepID=UPI003604CA39
MSVPTGYQGTRVNADRGENILNKTQSHYPEAGDGNANLLPSIADQEGQRLLKDAEYSTSAIPPLVSRSESPDKFAIWRSEQQLMQPELREFELLECQEIHTFQGNRDQGGNEEYEEDEGGSMRDGKDEGPMSISSSSTTSSASVKERRNDNKSNKIEGRIEVKKVMCHSTEELDVRVTGSEEQKHIRSSRTRDRERWKGSLKESKSETNVFVSSLSAVCLSGSLSGPLESGEVESPTNLCNSKTNPYSNTSSTTSAQTRRGAAPIDANQNFPLLYPQENHDHAQNYSQVQRQVEGLHRRNGSSSDGGLGQRRKAGFEERAMPPRRQQLVRPLCQTEIGRARSLPEPSAHKNESGQLSSVNLPTESHSSDSNRKFTKSALREPSDFSSLYNTSVSQLRQPNPLTQRDVPPAENPPDTASWRNSSPSNPSASEKRSQTQLTYRRNCSSPNRMGIDSRSSTPPDSPLRTPLGSPRRQPSMYIVTRNASGVVIPSGCNLGSTTAQGNSNSCLRAPLRTNVSTSGIPKAPLNNQQSSNHNSTSKESSPSPKTKPKGVRPKIITYVRKNPQFKAQASDGTYQVSSLPSRLSTYTQGPTATSLKDTPKDPSKPDPETRGAPVLSASNLLYEKHRQEMQASIFPSGMLSRSIRPPGRTQTVPPAHTHSHTAPSKLGCKIDSVYGASMEMGKSASFKGSASEDALQTQTAAQVGGNGSLLRAGRGLRLGLGAVARTTAGSMKGRGPEDRVFTHHDAAQPPAAISRSPKASQSGLRPPSSSCSRLPAGRLAAFGFIRSSSASAVPSVHPADSAPSDPCRPGLSTSEEPPLLRVTTSPPLADHQRGPPCRSVSLQPPSTPVLPRRYLPPQPRSSPGVGRKDFQRNSEVARSLPSSPKRLAVVPPKPQSPVQSSPRPAAAVRGSALPGSPCQVAPLRLQQENLQREKEEAQQKERRRQEEEREKEMQREEVHRLQGRCEQQERQLRALRDELRKTSLGLEAFIITTQHYCLKNKTAEEKQRKLSLEMQKIREEMASNSARWERLHREKTALEVAFEQELQELQLQQEAELLAVEEGLRKCHSAEAEHLRAEHRSEMEELRTQQQEQVEEMTINHQGANQELRDMHNITMATLHEEHARTMRDLRKAHEQQKVLLEEDFEKLRLSLQDQVDTLTFQNQSLRDKARRFEEALRRSTDEQIIDALAPYQHIEQDLKSLKEVVEMKNQQIHQQETKISDLEKVQAQKNVTLEERVQVLQQQNEDLMARVQMNLALSRQLSEENANLQESVEKQSTEKKRLSQNNEELLWRLQTSPLISPASSPLHRSFSSSPVPSSPFFCHSPLAGCDSPTHCHGRRQQAQYDSPSHRATTNQNLSPGPDTPTHGAACNQNYSPGPATPTHRASANRSNSTSCFSSL